MGEASPEAWTEEFRRTGRVVFPARRRPAIVRLLIVVVVFGVNPAVSLAINLHDGRGEVVLRLVSFAFSLILIGFCIWQLVTRRPVLIVDQDGIRFGRKKFMPWTDLGTIGTPHGPRFFRMLPLIPNDVWAEHLRLTQDNVKDIPAFAQWLKDLRAHHATDRGGAS
jgi:hypothetical protein